MPFTPCHIAAVLPLRRKGTLLPLAIGAMVPDLGYYVSPSAYFSMTAHSLERSLTFCLPMGVLIVCFILLAERGWKPLLPIHVSVERMVRWRWTFPFWIWIGAGTHIFWDAWTHRDGYFVTLWPELPFRWLQRGSTVLGGLVLFLWAYKKLAGRSRLNRRGLVFFAASATLAAVITCANLSPGDPHAMVDRRWYFLLLTSLIGNCLLFVTGVVTVISVAAIFLNKKFDPFCSSSRPDS